jgi:hypothetical protein
MLMRGVGRDQDNHCERLAVIKRIRKNMIYGRNLATNPATIKNMIMFNMILFLDFFSLYFPWVEVTDS